MCSHRYPYFINSHVRTSSKNFNLRKLIFTSSSWEQFRVCDVNLDFKREILLLGKPVCSSWKDVCGYCNGLFLFKQDCKFGFSLWNPSTKQFRVLPNFPLRKAADHVHSKYIIGLGLGLGYDDSNQDYKAICIVRDLSEPIVQFWVCGLKSNNWRRTLDFPYLDDSMIVSNAWYGEQGIGRFADASLHWLCYKGHKPEIVAFDVIKETFSIVPQPICRINSVNEVKTELQVLEGCLFMSYFSRSQPLHAYLYIRKKVGVDQFSWIKLFSLSKHSLGRRVDGKFWLENMKVLGYSERQNTILLYLYKDGMVWYDVNRKSFAEVEIDEQVSTWYEPIPSL